jgi:hypothetical protein
LAHWSRGTAASFGSLREVDTVWGLQMVSVPAGTQISKDGKILVVSKNNIVVRDGVCFMTEENYQAVKRRTEPPAPDA